MKRWTMVAGFFATLFVAPALAGAAEIPDAARGRALYENHCQVCHTPNIHSRLNRIPLNADELRRITAHWSRQENLRWSAEEVEDVVYHLRLTRYGF